MEASGDLVSFTHAAIVCSSLAGLGENGQVELTSLRDIERSSNHSDLHKVHIMSLTRLE